MQGIKVLGQGPAVILLHSSLSSSKQWLPLCFQLQDSFTLINVDLLGYGDAGLPDDLSSYTFEDELTRIEQCLLQENIQTPIHLVGHSCGGAVALAWAMKNRQRVASLSLFEPVAFHLLEQAQAQYFQQVSEFSQQLRQLESTEATAAFVNFWNGEQFFQQLPQKVQQQMALAMPKVHADFQGILDQSYQLIDLSQLLCPCLLVIGEQTRPLSKVLSQLIAEHLFNAHLHYVEGGHMAPVSHPQETVTLFSQFLNQQKKPGE
ncbi:alpha/beta fold hydrolase [Thalassotalea sp. PP2-459]|uniref:alpha/beta fold hydrolase n=1 Tax=Thalassotalea sp. PP2-459 TaxID=1742724 RepID=UPI0009431CAF|nr:alpha/beta hydrolase [Thalassotalea sp. PP2-459]OKY27998.1 hypothetical protein BI291_06500 [Thalassotalea sp. PP2-459]